MQVSIEKTGMSKLSRDRVTERDENGVATKTVTDNHLHLLVKFPELDRRKEYPVQVLLPADEVAIRAAVKAEGERLLADKQTKDALDIEGQAYMTTIAGADVDRVELTL
ncbi:hypothetical protein ACFL3G_07615 [Planctomycetota bacterium]